VESGMESSTEGRDGVLKECPISTSINDLPDEVLENIFGRLSPYRDLDSAKIVSVRWNRLANGNNAKT